MKPDFERAQNTATDLLLQQDIKASTLMSETLSCRIAFI